MTCNKWDHWGIELGVFFSFFNEEEEMEHQGSSMKM